jgi:hypothetical protein
VAVRLHGGVAGYAGLSTCGSVWVDPVCNAKIMARRAVEIGAAVATWQQHGGKVAFVTFTMRHHRAQRLDVLWNAVSTGWNKTVGGTQWIKDQRRHDVAGWLKLAEVTTGANGWHVHLHSLVFLDGSATDQSAAALHGRMFGRWARALERLGFGAPLLVGQDCHLVTDAGDAALAAYFTKNTDAAHKIGLELTQAQTKGARTRLGTRPPWALLDDVEHLGLAESLALWQEWEQGSKGRKQLTWSKGLRNALGLLAEESDDDVVAAEFGSSDDDLVLIDAAGWRHLTAVPTDLADLLSATQSGGLGSLRAFLDAREITYTTMDREAAA